MGSLGSFKGMLVGGAVTAEDDVVYERSLLGVDHTAGSFHVSKEMIMSFAKTMGETNPLFIDEERGKEAGYGGIIAPPTFCNIFASSIKRPDIQLNFGDVILFAGQSMNYWAPVRPGDQLLVMTRLKDVYTKTGRSGKMVFIVWETSFTNQNGRVVNLVKESFVRRNMNS